MIKKAQDFLAAVAALATVAFSFATPPAPESPPRETK
ncbi:MAG: hypothetical protein V7604_2701, partial [Hyphomicrobiales bacterium]